MGAVTYDAVNLTDPMPSFPGVGVSLTREFQFTVAVALIANDKIRLARIPLGAIVFTDYYMEIPDLDTNGTPTITTSFGHTDDTDEFIDASTVGQSAGKLSMEDGVAGSVPCKFDLAVNTKFWIIEFEAGAATGATAVVIRGWLRYHYSGIATPLPQPS